MSSAPSRASRCPARRSSAATATPPATAASARWRSASAPARSSMCWRRRRCCSSPRRRWKCASRATVGPGVTAKDIILHIIGTDRRRGRHRPCHRIYRQRDPRAERRGPADGQQHGDRGRRARRADRARRQRPSPISKGRPYAPKGADWDAAVAYWTSLATDPGATLRQDRRHRRRRHRADRDLGHQPRGCRADHRHRPRSRELCRSRRSRPPRAKSLAYMGLEPGTRMQDVADREYLHRQLHQQPHRGSARRRRGAERAAQGRQRQMGDRRPRIGAGEGAGRGRGARPHLHRRRVSNGASRAVRRASA